MRIIVANGRRVAAGLVLCGVAGALPAAPPEFGNEAVFVTRPAPYTPLLVDLDADGRLDVVVPQNGDASVGIFLNRTENGAAQARFAARQDIPVGSLPRAVASADFDGDGSPDLAVARSDGAVVLLINGTPAQADALSFESIPLPAAGNVSIAAADIDRDGAPDLAAASSGVQSRTSVWLNRSVLGAIRFDAAAKLFLGRYASLLQSADLNDDLVDDLLVVASPNFVPFTGTIGTQIVAASLLNTTAPGADAATFSPAWSLLSVSALPAAITNAPASDTAVADFNADGLPDVIATGNWNEPGGQAFVGRNAAAPADTRVRFVALGAVSVGHPSMGVAAADFDGDGDVDAAVCHGEGVTLLDNETAAGAETFDFDISDAGVFFSSFQYGLRAGDLNGDARPDLVAISRSGSEPGSLSVLLQR